MLNRTAIRLRSILLACLFATMSASAYAQSSTLPGESRIYSTIYSIGVEWDLTGDSNHSAHATVMFRVQGTENWAAAMPLVRVDFNGANMLAGSLLNLVPGTIYDVSLSLTDPDGGTETRALTATTRLLPVLPSGGRTLEVTTGQGGGDGSPGNPFRGIAAAQNGAGPGDVLLLHAGSYGGRVRFDRAGTPAKHIAWKAYGDGEVQLDGIDIAASHVWLEGLTVRNQSHATFSIGAPDDVVIRRCFFYNNHYSVYLQQGGTNWYIADNTIVGDTPYESESFDGEGIELNQSGGHTVAHNSITRVADGISYPLRNVDIFGNDIFDTSDDGVEPDYGFANIRIWGNRIHNAVHNGISFQPQNGGPWYIVRNQVVGNKEGAFKFRTTDRFVLLHNTIVNWGDAWPGDAMICCNEDHLLRGLARNNLWVSVNGGQIWGFDAVTRDWRSDLDFDGFDWGAAQNPFSYGGSIYGDLTSFAAASGLERFGIRIPRSCFATFDVPSAPPSPVPPQAMTLAPGCSAIDVGATLPGVNDGFHGAGPDLGAHELGAPAPMYGPRTKPTAHLSLSASHVSAGGQATLSWTTTDATSVTIDAVGAVAGSGYAEVGPGQSTTYTLTASSPSGIVTASATLTVDDTPPPAVVPAAPDGLIATAVASDRVRLTWNDSSTNEDGFAIEQSSDGVAYQTVGTTESNVTTYDATGLTASTTYTYRVRAFNTAGASPSSATAMATTLQAPLGAPSALAAAVLSKTQIRLTWRDNSGAEIGFRVERSTNSRMYSQLASVGAGVTTFTDSGARAGQTYYYRVIAYAATAASAPSNIATATTPRK